MDVHLWLTRTDGPHGGFARAGALLDPAERARAEAFRFDEDRRRFTLARAFLRTVLGQHLDIEPGTVRLHEERGEKPRLEEATRRLEFSLSRSGHRVLCGVASSRRLGVDIERIQVLPHLESVAARTMTPEELQRWSAGPEPTRGLDFFRAWTRKEALGKAGGHGLSAGLQNLPVPSELPAGFAVSVRGVDAGSRWLMSDLTLDENTIGCVVVETLDEDATGAPYEDRVVSGAEHTAGGATLQVPPGATLIVRRFGETAADAKARARAR